MENFVVSARKYRPMTFDTVVGQGSITNTLKNAIRNNTLAQAFLFCGPRGVGKTTCARIMAKTINCLNPTENMEACNECESCRAFNNNASFNIYELDAASNNSVEDIRSLVDQVRIPPQIGQYKVYIIDEVHMLSAAAFNAFLKTLEEPPAYAKFILATTEKHKIIPTILSRCQIFDFKRITVDDIAKHLAYVAQSEGVDAEPEALNIIAQKADGALRDALSIFDQMVSFSGKSITYQAVIENLNVLDYDYYFKIVDHILRGETSDILLILNDIIGKGFEPQHFVSGMGNHLRSLMVCKDPITVQLLEVSEQLRQRYLAQSQACPMPFLIKALEINNQCDIDYRAANNKRLHLEIALLKMCALCSQALNMPTAQTQPVQMPQNKPAQQQSTSLTAGHDPLPLPAQAAQQQPTPTMTTGHAPLPPTHNPNPIQTTTPQPSNNSTIQQSTVQQSTAPVSTGSTSAQPIVRPRGTTSSISINKAMQQAEQKTEEKEETWNNAFTQEQLTASWADFVNRYKNVSPNFAAALGKYTPKLIGSSEIHFSVDNKLFENDTEGMSALKRHLKNSLHNNQFALKPEVMERPAEIEAYTDKDKFEKMVEERPYLRTLQTELKLEGDL
ncbi:MAG: DNA polymerase III subunit gamma/tau [Bacteroidales bacterium]|jgi:DNA polymerase-3 subunit gamma/tau|nr:DNA polymerase III subunit gamma/tau [Bacteroidales bacterium]